MERTNRYRENLQTPERKARANFGEPSRSSSVNHYVNMEQDMNQSPPTGDRSQGGFILFWKS